MPSQHRKHFLQRMILIANLGLLATLACDVSVDYGITCLKRDGTRIIAIDGYLTNEVPDSSQNYVSNDGGLNWVTDGVTRACDKHPFPSQLFDPNDSQLQIRFVGKNIIESSRDGGQTWQQESNLPLLTDAEVNYLERTRPFIETGIDPTPQDALIDPLTGNLIVAMGQAGLLVRTQDGNWHWVKVGKYFREEIDFPKAIGLIDFDIALALVVPFIVFGLIRLSFNDARWWHFLVGVMMSLMWVAAVFLLPIMAQIWTNDQTFNIFLPILPVFFIVAPWGLYSLNRLNSISPESFGSLLATGISGAILFLLPHLLWAFNIIDNHVSAICLSIGLVIVASLYGGRIVRRNMRDPEIAD
jgi:hypothetical protein